MGRKNIIAIVCGAILAALGILWFLQGSDIVHIRPILCVANCEPITGHTPLWQVIGAVAFIAGVWLVGVNIRKSKRKS